MVECCLPRKSEEKYIHNLFTSVNHPLNRPILNPNFPYDHHIHRQHIIWPLLNSEKKKSESM
jgi:hypothetical protein